MPSLSLAPLRHRAFRLYWTGAFLSNIGTWMETVALGYYVADVTRQALWNGALAAAAFLPWGLLGPVGGALADRWNRKTLLLGTTAVQAALAGLLSLLVALDQAPPGALVLIMLVSGCATALGFPAYQAVIPQLVPEGDLVAAIGLGSAQWNLGRIVGPVLAGVAIALGGVATALAINAASFVAVIVVLLLIAIPPPVAGLAAGSIAGAIRQGLSFIRSEPGLRVTFVILCAVTFLAAPFIALAPAMAVQVLGGDDVTTAILITAQGIGAVTAALFLGGLTERFGLRRVLVMAVTLLPFALIAYAVAPSLVPMAMMMVLVGALYVTELNAVSSIVQLRSPNHLRGRVLSLNLVVLGLLYPVGALLQGQVADTIGLRVTTAGAAVLLLVLLLVGRAARPHATEPLERPPVVPPLDVVAARD